MTYKIYVIARVLFDQYKYDTRTHCSMLLSEKTIRGNARKFQYNRFKLMHTSEIEHETNITQIKEQTMKQVTNKQSNNQTNKQTIRRQLKLTKSKTNIKTKNDYFIQANKHQKDKDLKDIMMRIAFFLIVDKQR